MGEYFRAVCHDCKEKQRSFGKLREIMLNVNALMEVGAFFALHAGHHVELRGDEYTYDGTFEKDTEAHYIDATGSIFKDSDLALTFEGELRLSPDGKPLAAGKDGEA